MCRIADAHGITVTMRIPDGRESTILSFLDRGVRGITVPNLLTREEAEKLVKYSFFAPRGRRQRIPGFLMRPVWGHKVQVRAKSGPSQGRKAASLRRISTMPCASALA